MNEYYGFSSAADTGLEAKDTDCHELVTSIPNFSEKDAIKLLQFCTCKASNLEISHVTCILSINVAVVMHNITWESYDPTYVVQ